MSRNPDLHSSRAFFATDRPAPWWKTGLFKAQISEEEFQRLSDATFARTQSAAFAISSKIDLQELKIQRAPEVNFGTKSIVDHWASDSLMLGFGRSS